MIPPYIFIGLKPELNYFSPEIIIDATCKYFGLSKDKLTTSARKIDSYKRYLAMYLIRSKCLKLKLSNWDIAEMFYPAVKATDHSIISHANRRVNDWLQPPNTQTKKDLNGILSTCFYMEILKQAS